MTLLVTYHVPLTLEVDPEGRRVLSVTLYADRNRLVVPERLLGEDGDLVPPRDQRALEACQVIADAPWPDLEVRP